MVEPWFLFFLVEVIPDNHFTDQLGVMISPFPERLMASLEKWGIVMTCVRLGYVAMSVHLPNSSPSHTMTFTHFQKLEDREAAINKLATIAKKNLNNCLRLLRYNHEHDISFFRFSSKLLPLGTHEVLENIDIYEPLAEEFATIRNFLREHPRVRVDFHPDHFVILNSPKADVLQQAIKTLIMHERLLRHFGLDPMHRCVLHVGGKYGDKEKALEQFIHNWGFIPRTIQEMIILENDDKTFTVEDTLYLCEKLGIPLVFDLHHHEANHDKKSWEVYWERICATWQDSPLPIKIHISSPRSESNFRAHANYIEPGMFINFLEKVKGSVRQIDVMIEAKQKDEALFQLVRDLKEHSDYEWVDQASFYI